MLVVVVQSSGGCCICWRRSEMRLLSSCFCALPTCSKFWPVTVSVHLNIKYSDLRGNDWVIVTSQSNWLPRDYWQYIKLTHTHTHTAGVVCDVATVTRITFIVLSWLISYYIAHRISQTLVTTPPTDVSHSEFHISGGSRNFESRRRADDNVSASSSFIANAHNELCLLYWKRRLIAKHYKPIGGRLNPPYWTLCYCSFCVK